MKKIGFISILGMRGQWYLTQNFMRALQDEHELFLLARPFGVRDGTFLGNIDDFGIKTKVVYSSTYALNPEIVAKWVKDNKLDIVFYNEEYDWRLVEAAKQNGAKVITYLDYFTENDIPKFQTYDRIIACAEHAYNIFVQKKVHTIVEFINWGVDTDLFKPTEGIQKATFFHSAGWGGINWRKCSPDILKIFDSLRSDGYDFTMCFHSQTAKHQYDKESQEALDRRVADGSLEVVWGSIPHPGLYHKGHINLAPSRLEGLGLFLYEGLACGMPTITTDAPPMNQPVEHEKNGLLVKTIGQHYRKDPYFFPEYDIDMISLREAMITLGSDSNRIASMSAEARAGIEKAYSYEIFAQNVRNSIKSL